MKLYMKISFILFLFLLSFSSSYAQVVLTLPSTSGVVGDDLTLPININNVNGLTIKSYQFTIYYNPAIIKIYGLTNSGTMSSAASAQSVVDTVNGKIRIAWASSDSLQGSGVLLKIKIKIKGTGTTSLTYMATDGSFVSEFGSKGASISATNGTVTTSTTNNPPTLNLNPMGPYNINGGETIHIKLEGSDVNTADQLTYLYVSTPLILNANFSSVTGDFIWTPANEDEGNYSITFKVTDGKDTTSISTTLKVIGVNVAPTLSLSPTGPTYQINEGSLLSIQLIGDDTNPNDKDSLNYSVINKPSGSTLTGDIFEWTPTFDQGKDDSYYMTFKVTDKGGLSASLIITVNVKNVNREPAFTAELPLNSVANVHIAPNPVYFTFQYTAQDPDGDNVLFALFEGPAGSSITSTGLFSWAPIVAQAGNSYTVKILISDGKLSKISTSTITASSTITGVENIEEIPNEFKLQQNYPNPFNPSTVINFSLMKDSYVKLSVYNVIGQLVKELINGKMSAGYHSINFNAGELNSGIYIYKLETPYYSSVKKMIFEK